MEIILTKAENHALEVCKQHHQKTKEIPYGDQLAFLLGINRSGGYHYIKAFCELGILQQVKKSVFQWTDTNYEIKIRNRVRGQ